MKRCTDTIEDHSSEPDSAFFRTRHADSYAACGIAIIRRRNGVITYPLSGRVAALLERERDTETNLMVREFGSIRAADSVQHGDEPAADAAADACCIRAGYRLIVSGTRI